MTNIPSYPFFAPQLFIKNHIKDISFYSKAFGAVELLCFKNDDGSIHVAEFSINGAIFHIHEITSNSAFVTPDKNNATTVLIGLFVTDVDLVIKKAIIAGAIEIKAPKDFEYGYRQGEIKDPFGHHWLIQSVIV